MARVALTSVTAELPADERPAVSVPTALALAVLGGALLSGQARVNGAFAVRLGSPVVTALVSFAVGTVAVGGLVAASARARRALRRRRGSREPVRWWYCVGGLGGASLVAVSALAVPEIGVAFVAVAVVVGQTVGGLGVDRVGLGPSGRHPVTSPRIAGATLAVAALGLAALGSPAGDFRPALFAVIAAAGLFVAGQQAANGRLQRATGEARFAAFVSFVGGTLALALVTGLLAVTGGLSPLHWPAPSGLWLGGVGGAVYITTSALIVRVLGVLRLTLGSVAGQLVGGVILDVTVPVHGRGLAPATLAAAGVTLAAVGVSGISREGRS